MKKLLIFIIVLIIFVIFLFSLNQILFNNQNQNENKNDNTTEKIYVVNNDVHKESENYTAWKSDVAKRLYKEFCEFYENMPNDDYVNTYHKGLSYGYQQARYNGKTGYSRLMAADRACGILTVYGNYLTAEELKDVKNKAETIRNDFFTKSIVNFGYTQSGLHFITISYAEKFQTEQKFSANQIRNLSNESDFLIDYKAETGQQLLDVFAEDLSPNKSNIKVEPILLDCIENNKFYKIERTTVLENTSTEFLNESGRNCITDTEITLKSGTWKLFPFDYDTFADGVIMQINGEELYLFNATLDKTRLIF